MDAIGLFIPTTLTGTRNSEMFDAPIAYLRANLHLQRAVSVDGSLPHNVGALLGFGSLQYAYMPVPMIWATFMQQNLNPSAWIRFPDWTRRQVARHRHLRASRDARGARRALRARPKLDRSVQHADRQ